jgi:hypothetical protein
VPVTPVLIRLASRIAYDAAGGIVTLDRGPVHIVVAVVFVDGGGVPFVEVGPVARALGESAAFDPVSKTLAISIAADGAIATPSPYVPGAPQVAPTTIFTAAPPPPTPHATPSGIPHPRRTAIPAQPSQPVESASPRAAITRRRSGF